LRFWGNFDEKIIFGNTDQWSRSVFIFFEEAKVPEERVILASKKYDWIL
jgi:hypothetical protein